MRKYRGPVVEVSPIYSTPGALGGWMIDRIRIGAGSGSLDSAIAIPRETILEELGRRGRRSRDGVDAASGSR